VYYPILYDGLIFIGWWLGLFKLFLKKSAPMLQKMIVNLKKYLYRQFSSVNIGIDRL
jgi:hypothetical protein